MWWSCNRELVLCFHFSCFICSGSRLSDSGGDAAYCRWVYWWIGLCLEIVRACITDLNKMSPGYTYDSSAASWVWWGDIFRVIHHLNIDHSLFRIVGWLVAFVHSVSLSWLIRIIANSLYTPTKCIRVDTCSEIKSQKILLRASTQLSDILL